MGAVVWLLKSLAKRRLVARTGNSTVMQHDIRDGSKRLTLGGYFAALSSGRLGGHR